MESSCEEIIVFGFLNNFFGSFGNNPQTPIYLDNPFFHGVLMRSNNSGRKIYFVIKELDGEAVLEEFFKEREENLEKIN